jgi:chorismate-pyruvate lyase
MAMNRLPRFAERMDRLSQAVHGASRMAGATLPEPYRSLLVHSRHMTVTVEAHYGQPVDVVVLESIRDGDDYGRKILLKLRDGSQVVQFGAVQINLALLPIAVRTAIEAEDIPLGRVLIEHNVLTHVEPMAYFQISADAEFAKWFAIEIDTMLYGRLGAIFAGDAAAIEVLEVLAPVIV